MVTALLGILLVGSALIVLLFLVSLLFNALHLPLSRAIEQRRFAMKQERGRRGDRFLDHGDVPRALEEFRRAFYLQTIISDRLLSSKVHDHHTGLLSRLISVTEEVQGGSIRLMSLAKADRLLSERADLQRRYFRARDGNGQASDTRQIYGKLRQNRRELKACLRQLVNEIATSGPGTAERYH